MYQKYVNSIPLYRQEKKNWEQVGRKPQSKSYMWLYRSGNDGKNPIVLYDYQPSGNGDHAVNYLLDGRYSLSNNAAENAICPFTVGRKN